jgi:hypothetical protein
MWLLYEIYLCYHADECDFPITPMNVIYLQQYIVVSPRRCTVYNGSDYATILYNNIAEAQDNSSDSADMSKEMLFFLIKLFPLLNSNSMILNPFFE